MNNIEKLRHSRRQDIKVRKPKRKQAALLMRNAKRWAPPAD